MLIIIERRSVDKVTLTCKVLKQKQKIISKFKYISYYIICVYLVVVMKQDI